MLRPANHADGPQLQVATVLSDIRFPKSRSSGRAVRGLLLVALLLAWRANWQPTLAADRESFRVTAAPLLRQLCSECHGEGGAEARINLQRLSNEPDFAARFKVWENVVAMLERHKMPPDDMPQPDERQRRQLVATIRAELQRSAEEQAGDPGQIVLRRLTNAEFAYTVHDLTGLNLDLQRQLVGDAVGGEGFTNIGIVQFIQDSTLQRYLDVSKQVAAHAVIGAGPLHFFPDPGKTGLELSAINRIQSIYRSHGFRTGAGEGGEAFGLDQYPKAFNVAWLFHHRAALGIGTDSLAELAAKEGLSPRFAEHIWSVLTRQSPTYPLSDVVAVWQQLPRPGSNRGGDDEALQSEARSACDQLYAHVRDWQQRLANAAGDIEEAAVLTDDVLELTPSVAFETTLRWPEEAKKVTVNFSVELVDPRVTRSPLVVWKDPRLRFRLGDNSWTESRSLQSQLSQDTAAKVAFGKHPQNRGIQPGDFVTEGAMRLPIDILAPDTVEAVELTVEAQLDLPGSSETIVRCAISSQAERNQAVSAVLADPTHNVVKSWQAGVTDFARNLPQVSHREPAPSDRDPIPPPFDNSYNTRERDHFHYKVKYHRDDSFLVDKILDDATRSQLDDAWTDLLGSFEYHDVLLRFVAKKFQLQLPAVRIDQLERQWILGLSDPARTYIAHLQEHYQTNRASMRSAQAGHIDDALRLASRAWRRPLSAREQRRLRTFYASLREDNELDHVAALRALLARILIAPPLLYRAETTADEPGVKALNDWELASRLSYFLWSSLPDAELRRAAAAGRLREPDQLQRQARRMLRDPKARRMATEFFGQWFGFYRFDEYRGVDAKRFPEFTDALKAAMYDEAISFFEYIVRRDRPVREMLDADYTFVNAELARHYGLAEVKQAAADRVTRVPDVRARHRGGLLRLGAVLTVTSAPLRTSAVRRGDWILRRVIGTPVPPPPADAGSIPADDVLADGLTVRERLESHRRNPSCVNCHSRIDPLGFALENFDAIGRWRTEYRDGQRIDSAGILADGKRITGSDGLQDYLQQNREQFHRLLCAKLLGYALGRSELASDRLLLEQMLADSRGGEGRLSDLVARIVSSSQFRFHRGRNDEQPVSLKDVAEAWERSEHAGR